MICVAWEGNEKEKKGNVKAQEGIVMALNGADCCPHSTVFWRSSQNWRSSLSKYLACFRTSLFLISKKNGPEFLLINADSLNIYNNCLYVYVLFCIWTAPLREDTHKKKFFFSGRATKGVGRVNPPDHKAKNTFF